MWNRDPFLGGCSYFSEFAKVTGYYSHDPLEFESDCSTWTASNLPDKVFQTAGEAMEAAESADQT